MTPIQTAYILGVVVLLVIGQLLFKVAARQLPVSFGADVKTLLALAFNVPLIAALMLYAVTTILWAIVLREVGLSRAYPFMALSMVFVPAAGVFVFGEPWTRSLAIGATLILAGLLVISRDMFG